MPYQTIDEGATLVNSSVTPLFVTKTDTDKSFSSWINLDVMESGDEYEMICLVQAPNEGASTANYFTRTFIGVQSDPNYFIPWLPTDSFGITMQKISGVDRTFNWNVKLV